MSVRKPSLSLLALEQQINNFDCWKLFFLYLGAFLCSRKRYKRGRKQCACDPTLTRSGSITTPDVHYARRETHSSREKITIGTSASSA